MVVCKWGKVFVLFESFFFYQNMQAVQASYISSQLYHLLEACSDDTLRDKTNACLIFLAMQLLQIDCVPLGEFILNDINVNTEDEKVDLVRAAYLIRNGKVFFSLCFFLNRILQNLSCNVYHLFTPNK